MRNREQRFMMDDVNDDDFFFVPDIKVIISIFAFSVILISNAYDDHPVANHSMNIYLFIF